MNFVVIGVNHQTAPVEVREQFAISEARLPEAVKCLATYPGIEEGMIVSTCNRVEMLARTTNGSADLQGFLRQFYGFDPEPYRKYLYEYRERDAVRHVFRVASSLDSMIVGEPQILGQVKEAYATARAVGAVNSQLDALLTRAFAVAKRVRNETAVATSAVSIASVAVDLAKKIFGNLQGKSVYLVGAGKMCELAARHLLAHGAKQIYVANRTYERAVALAKKFNGEAIPFEKLYETVPNADIVISSTGAPHAIFRKEHGEKFLSQRRNRPMFFIDIAVPRDIDPEMNKLDGIFVYDIDDLQQVVSSHIADRRTEADRAEAIVQLEVDKFESRLQTLDVVPTIVSLQEHLETVRQAEIDRVRGRLGTLTPEQELAVEALTRGIINKIMHTPITTLKSAARESSEATTVIDLVRKLFGLREPSKAARGRCDCRGQRKTGSAKLMARLRIGSRGSQLALWQANHISALLRERGHEVELEIIKTTGDKITDVALAQVGTKGMFTKEIEEALAEGRVDLAVHSLKDLPTELPPGFELVAITTRVNPRDVFLSVKYDSVKALPQGARVGTSSLRRQAQLKASRPDLVIHPLRGNVDTRMRKLEEGEYDAIILAAAGLTRLGKTRTGEGSSVGRVHVSGGRTGRAGHRDPRRRCGDAQASRVSRRRRGPRATTCERALLNKLGGGCQVPIGAFAEMKDGELQLTAIVARPDGTEVLREQQSGSDPVALGEQVGDTLLRRGATRILEDVYGAATAAPQQP